jgi:transketolase
MGEQITYYSVSEAIESTTDTESLYYYPKEEFSKIILNSKIENLEKVKIFSYMCRLNTLYMIAKAGSGHIGGSFSSIDIASYLYLNHLTKNDRYFSSKGHDAPGLYSIHAALGIIEFDKIHNLRRINGLPGHPDVKIDGAFTNTGSLGMGVSKAKGFLFSDLINKKNESNIFVLMGDGELQEGQFWESLLSASRITSNKLTIIIDNNKIQSDTYVKNVNDLGDLEAKLVAFGFYVCRCNGNDMSELNIAFNKQSPENRVKIIIADTIKGFGVSFMQPQENEYYYKFHSGSPKREQYNLAKIEIENKIITFCQQNNVDFPKLKSTNTDPIKLNQDSVKLIDLYSENLLEISNQNTKIVALDADLILDTGLINFKNNYPERFIECGISEQDMVSQAGTIALSNLIPIAHSFACFLTSRASEQIYNNCTQNKKVIYVGSLAGLLPAGPGHSHQSLRDITAMSSMINMKIVEPVTPIDLKNILNWAVSDSVSESVYIRLTSIPISYSFDINENKTFSIGAGNIIKQGGTIKIFVTNPIIVNEVYKAILKIEKETNLKIELIYTCWLSDFDILFYEEVFSTKTESIFIFENHYVETGFSTWFLSKLILNNLIKSANCFTMGVTEIPNYGRNDEVLKYHKLDAESIEKYIIEKHDKKS